MRIRKLSENDSKAASVLLWETFYAFEKNNFSMDGMEKFRDLTSPLSLKMNMVNDYLILLGAFEKKELVGVCAVREKKHILLLYVRNGCCKKGIGSALLGKAEALCEGREWTLNSSDNAVLFYEKFGYQRTGARVTEDDFIFTPMKKIR